MSADLYLGIDQSVGGFGVTFLEPEHGWHDTQVKSFPLAKFGGREVIQLNGVESWLINVLAKHPGRIKAVAREGFSYGSMQGREKAGALAYAVDSTLAEWLPEPVCYPSIFAPTTVKQFATNNGSADKEQVKAGIERIWGIKFDNDNAADAYVIARMAYAVDTGETAERWQDQILDNILNPKKKRSKKKS